MLEAVPDAIVLVDELGTIVLVNVQAEALFGYPRDELMGQPVTLLMPQRFRDGHSALRERYMERPAVRSMGVGLDLRGRRKDGSEFPVEVSLSPFDTGEQVLTVSAIRDVTERRDAEDARMRLLEEQGRREQAEAALREREIFLSVAAHELRTPLTGLIGYTQLASRRAAQSDRLEGAHLEHLRGTLDTITEQANRAGRLVAQLLESARLLSGQFELHRAPCDAGGAVLTAVEMARMAAEHPSRIRLDVRDEMRIDVDQDRFGQVLLNLLDNACRYSDERSAIDVRVLHAGQHACITVRDHGIGVPEHARDSLFEPFTRVHSAEYRSGLGLGLYLSRAIIEAHGGTLSAEFPPDGGSIFVIAMPLMAAVPARR